MRTILEWKRFNDGNEDYNWSFNDGNVYWSGRGLMMVMRTILEWKRFNDGNEDYIGVEEV